MIDDIKKTLWASANKLRANMDAAQYKHLVLGLIFVKYISDAFEARQSELKSRLSDPADELFYGDEADEDIAAELEDRDYYTSENVFWVPEGARWEALRAAAPQPDIGKRIDDALSLIELDNPKLKGILDKRFARAQLPDGKLGELVNLVSTIDFGVNPSKARDILGQVYEYFLGMFASAEGKRGGQFYTPASIVKTLVAVLSPKKGQIYDPCCGSSGMFVQSEKFIENHGGKLGDVSIYGQEANPTTWRLAAMNLVIRGRDYNLGKEPADTFIRNQHPDLRADYVLANPPFNISDWWHASLDGDARWIYGTPPQGNANYAWLQHILHHLKPTGRAGIVLANGSMSSSQNSEGQIRAAMVDADVVEVMIALPGQLFFNTQIPACLWFLAKQKKRKGEVLFIDARKQATMISRVQSELTDEVIERISQTVASWRESRHSCECGNPCIPYQDIPGFCRSVLLAEIAQHGHVLTPGRYVGAEEVDFDPVHAKMQSRVPEGMDQATAALFPDSFEESQLGAVPKGWKWVPLNVAYEINPPCKLKKGETAPYLDMAGVQTQGHSVGGVVQREMGSGTKFINGDTLLARITPCLENGKTAFVDFLPADTTEWGSTEFVVLRPKDPLPSYHAYLLARHPAFREHAIRSMSGTSGRQRIQNDVLSQFVVTVPPEYVGQAFSELVTVIQTSIKEGHQQAMTLSALRDTLHPRPISGQLCLPEAQPIVESA